MKKQAIRFSIFSLGMTALIVAPVMAQDDSGGPGTSVGAQMVDISTPVVVNLESIRLTATPVWQPGDPIKIVPKLRPDPAQTPGPLANPVPLTEDPLVQMQRDFDATIGRAPERSPDGNFEAQTFSGVQPPDTVGDVGTTQYVQMINAGGGSSFVVYDKEDGSVLAGPVNMDSLYSGTGRECENGAGDPIVLFDSFAERWLLTEFSSNGNRLCVAISVTDDALGAYSLYEFTAPNFPDYPKYGIWHDGYYISTNEGSGSPLYALDRDAMLAADPASMVRTTVPDLAGFGFQALTPADADGHILPPASEPMMFIRHNDDEVHNSANNDALQDFLEIWTWDVDFQTPANSVLTGPINIGIGNIDSDLCGLFSFECFPEPGDADGLDPLREVVMWRAQYRNHGHLQTLVGNLVTDIDGSDHGGIRWFELRNEGGDWSLFQEGTFAPDDANRWMGSIAMDGVGNLAMGYSVGGVSQQVGIRTTERLASDPLGVMRTEQSLREGEGSHSGIRWGDYSALTVDPINDRRFWYTHEYPLANGTWNTYIGSFRVGDGDNDGISDSIDQEPMSPSNACSGPTVLLDGFSTPDNEIVDCAASRTISVDSVNFGANSTLKLIAPTVSFQPNFSVAQGAVLQVIDEF